MFNLTDQGPYSLKCLMLKVAPSDNILRNFLENCAFPLKIKENILVKISIYTVLNKFIRPPPNAGFVPQLP